RTSSRVASGSTWRRPDPRDPRGGSTRRRASSHRRGSAAPWRSTPVATSTPGPREDRARCSARGAGSGPQPRAIWRRVGGGGGAGVGGGPAAGLSGCVGGRGGAVGAHARVTRGAVRGDGTRLGAYSRLAEDGVRL